MGFLDWFSRRKDVATDDGEAAQSRFTDKNVAKLHKKLMNKWYQTLERKRVIQLLAQMGTQEAITALLGRFTFVTDGSIVDEDEKSLVYEILLDLEARAVPALKQFIHEEPAIYWPLKALTEIEGEETAVDTLLSALDGITDRWERSMERMHSLVQSLRDYQNDKVMERLIVLSKDDNEEIRFLSVDGLSMFDSKQPAVDAIIERLLDDNETTRVKTFIMDLLMERRWRVKKYRKELSGKLPETYFVDDTGVIQRKY
jgi:HEAT repeat protein